MSRTLRTLVRRVTVPALVAMVVVAGSACSGDDSGSTDDTAVLLTVPSETDSSSTTVPSTDSTVAGDTTVPTSSSDTNPAGSTVAPGSTPESTDAPAPTDPATTGDINETVPAEPQETLPSVPLDQATPVGTTQVAVERIERIEAEARLPGEIAGPAFAVHVTLTNESDAPIDLDAVSVNLFDGADAPASPLSSDPNAPFSGELASGQSVSAVYVFEFSDDRPQPVRVEVSTAVDVPVAVFTGTVN